MAIGEGHEEKGIRGGECSAHEPDGIRPEKSFGLIKIFVGKTKFKKC